MTSNGDYVIYSLNEELWSNNSLPRNVLVTGDKAVNNTIKADVVCIKGSEIHNKHIINVKINTPERR